MSLFKGLDKHEETPAIMVNAFQYGDQFTIRKERRETLFAEKRGRADSKLMNSLNKSSVKDKMRTVKGENKRRATIYNRSINSYSKNNASDLQASMPRMPTEVSDEHRFALNKTLVNRHRGTETSNMSGSVYTKRVSEKHAVGNNKVVIPIR